MDSLCNFPIFAFPPFTIPIPMPMIPMPKLPKIPSFNLICPLD